MVLVQLLINGFANGCLYAFLAFSFGLIYNTTRTLHIAHGAVYTLGAYLCYLFWTPGHLRQCVALCLAVLLSTFFGMAIELTVYAPLVRRGSSPLVAFLSSLGLYVSIANVIALLFGDETRVFSPPILGTYKIGIATLSRVQLIQIASGVILLPTLLLLIHLTAAGKAIRAIRDNQILVSLLGINVALARLGVFGIGSALVAFAAVLRTLDLGIDPQAGMPAMLIGAIGLIIGGVGTLAGPIFGGLLLGFLQSLVVLKVPTHWVDAITFMLLILVLLLRPTGLSARQRRIEELVDA